jgi:hypothetical protein
MRRTLSTPKGMALVGLGGFFIAAWLGSMLMQGLRSGPQDPEAWHRWVPVFVLFMLATSVLRSSADRAISFSPAEVQFLFTIIGMSYIGSPLRTFPGIFSTFLLVQFLSLLVAMVRERAGQVFTGRLGWGVGALVLILTATSLFAGTGALDPRDPQALLEAIRSGSGWRAFEVVLAPFILAITAPAPGELLLPLVGATLINGAVLGAILLLDANYLEASSRIGERIYADVQRAQTQGIARAKPSGRHRRVPRLPHWGGAGTMAWRQLVAVRRGPFGLVVSLLAIGAVVGVWLSISDLEILFVLVVGALLFPAIILIADYLRFDFRGDFEALEALKAMPLRPVPIVLGQIAVPTVLLTLLELVIVGPLLAAAGFPGVVPFAAIVLLMVNALIFSMKNYLFLHFPVSLRERNPADIRFFGRTVLFLMIEGIVVTAAVGVSAVIAFFASAAFILGLGSLGMSVPPAGLITATSAAFCVFFCALFAGPLFGLVWLTGRAYQNLDPSRLLAG